jgi:hypothetical protein
MTYAGSLDLNIYVQRDFAPLTERMRYIIAMEEKLSSQMTWDSESSSDMSRLAIDTL